MPPGDKYYVVDAVYPNRKGFLAPYRKGSRRTFYLHSSLRNIIERSFGVLKKRWPILQQMPNYSYETQVKIVIATIAIHNFIIEQRISDEVLQFSQDTMNGQQSTNDGDSNPGQENTNDLTMSMSAMRDSIRDQIAAAHGLNR
ncbi:hypothetical protein QJS10_CPB14g01405 [Acorus calamus]|uniref:DDE Tnp4 domain-containing protein n=1 Tax=Acorus calamus TaxID=4465 RepID=A0AAV9DEP2_ACOCL|nr:hypothetical protein QJS10_CPB14g01405 [Acorus calamus]